MKNLFKSYGTFSRMERTGIMGICAVIIILLIVRVTMHLWVHPAVNAAQEQKLIAAWQHFKSAQPVATEIPVAETPGTETPVTDTTATQSTALAPTWAKHERSKNDYEDAIDDNTAPMPDMININTADSATLVRLKGIGPATASKIIAYRKSNGPFKSVDELLDVRHIPDATFEIIKKHLTVNTSLHR